VLDVQPRNAATHPSKAGTEPELNIAYLQNFRRSDPGCLFQHVANSVVFPDGTEGSELSRVIYASFEGAHIPHLPVTDAIRGTDPIYRPQLAKINDNRLRHITVTKYEICILRIRARRQRSVRE
jgi:hypothetical protein